MIRENLEERKLIILLVWIRDGESLNQSNREKKGPVKY